MRKRGTDWRGKLCTCICHDPGNEGMKHFLACCGTTTKFQLTETEILNSNNYNDLSKK